MREIEIKARVRDEQALRDALGVRGVKLSEPIKQHDQVFGLPGAVGGSHSNWLRIRTENDNKHLFNLKRSVTGQLDSIEHETEVADAAEMENIIKELGYVPFSDITKTRQKAKIGDIEICLDSVDGLGVFIEAERLCEHDTDAVQVTSELWKLFTELGVSKIDEVLEGYDVMVKKLNLEN